MFTQYFNSAVVFPASFLALRPCMETIVYAADLFRNSCRRYTPPRP